MPTAIEHVKRFKLRGDYKDFPEQESGVIRKLLLDKGFSIPALRAMDSGELASIFQDLVVQSQALSFPHSAISTAIDTHFIGGHDLEQYVGDDRQFTAVDRAAALAPNANRTQSFSASTNLSINENSFASSYLGINQTPITILGAGVAGLMTTRALVDLGWDASKITVIDKKGEWGGLWNQKNVSSGSRNNPRDISFLNYGLQAAPGGGDEVVDYIQQLATGTGFASFGSARMPQIEKGIVQKVVPADLEHVITVKSGKQVIEYTSPIVINTLGIGKPRPISDPTRMTTNATASQAGPRWQQQLTPDLAEKYRNKSLVFVGLGNSTAEMMVQVQKLNSQGFNIDYHVLTHYPWEAIAATDRPIVRDNKTYKLFRDVNRPNLVDLSGDLKDIKDAFYNALAEGRIHPDVQHWDVDETGSHITIDGKRRQSEIIPADQVFTLIGYHHDQDALRTMGLAHTGRDNPSYDYDGEFHQTLGAEGRARVYPGYFGMGAILNSPVNENAIVIPGIIHRMPDMLFSIYARAMEYHAAGNVSANPSYLSQNQGLAGIEEFLQQRLERIFHTHGLPEERAREQQDGLYVAHEDEVVNTLPIFTRKPGKKIVEDESDGAISPFYAEAIHDGSLLEKRLREIIRDHPLGYDNPYDR